ncbi:hypothetical protein [Nocardioides sp. 503]|uniref:hypothetical protein n=1 Tax=Nocardioides sp. 503 TaxID=2508326 RepID=UPI0010704FF6|nr:hypothetical protein [Nocardioides sp. 503]
MELTKREILGVRASLLETITDHFFHGNLRLVEESKRLFSELDAAYHDESSSPRTFHFDRFGLGVLDRTFSHVGAVIEEWEFQTRIRLTVDEFQGLADRVRALCDESD